MKAIALDNSMLFPQLIELVELGHTVTINAHGNSMRPFIEDNRDKLVFGKAIDIKPGDVILAEPKQGHYVCHRVEKIDNERVVMRGDGNVPNREAGYDGTEVFTPDRIKAKLVQIVRKGKTYNTDTSMTWRIYSAMWTRLLPIRRWMLAIYRLAWRHEMPGRLKRTIPN